ncbi:sodium-dependent phosphate transport protein 1-like isoform X2 [Phyllostomus hastatus]|nr:sodium-dependent phosphate transport protein 1-like isoform X2 [Phyllostomus hastatus]XP_045672872.1 sodium-dependent phosphate transport protein 1-like isoform X2 [Phyllostomus hastatus]XP_045672873.1 sodium-dependent phosphate transport protein 1-like isoform X2 [Phyllostomus hastatus]
MDHPSPAGKGPGLCSLRFGLALLLLFCNVALLCQRSCLSLTMVAMVNSSALQGVPNASAAEPLDGVKSPVYNWSPQTQGIILSAIMYGMPVTQIPMGYLSGVYPIKVVTGVALLLSSVCSLLVPLAAEGGESLLIACRVVQGLSQGTVMVTQYTVWVRWAPPSEQSRLTSVSLSGNLLGPCLSLLVTGFISQALGWPMVFYIFGAGGCALSLLWFVLFYDDPEQHPCISLSEKEFMASSVVQVSSGGKSVPIKAMLKSLPVWAISLCCFAFSWTNTIMFMYMPTFLRAKLRIDMRENGLLSALPYLLCWVLGILAGYLADFFLARKILSLIAIRKLFTTLGLLLPALFSVSLLHPGASPVSVVTCLTLASATAGFCVAGVIINPLDIAPRYYGFLKGVTMLIGMTGGLISSTLTGIILNQDPESSWFKIFLLMAAINVATLIFYLVFTKADVQDWAKERQQTRL